MSTLANASPHLGTDPELFIARIGRKTGNRYVTGSEKVVPPGGIPVGGGGHGSVERDGVQCELHPKAHHCRESLSVYLAGCLIALQTEISKKPDLRIDFRRVVHVGEKELASLEPGNQVLGCMPSLNFYGTMPLDVDGRVMRMRSGSGHFHIGSALINNGANAKATAVVEPNRLVPILDLVVGIPAVLLTRDTAEEEAKRRKYYGRAGEYRLPRHGLEYRTLSNFWLRSYQLYHLMAGQVRNALNICYTETLKQGTFGLHNLDLAAATDLLKKFDPGAVSDAINTNDFKAAKHIFDDQVKPVLSRMHIGTGLDATTMRPFENIVAWGPDKFWKDDPTAIMNNWQTRSGGWESFSKSVPDYIAPSAKPEADARVAAGV